MSMIKKIVGLHLLSLASLIAGCGGGGGGEPGGATPMPTVTATAEPTPTPSPEVTPTSTPTPTPTAVPIPVVSLPPLQPPPDLPQETVDAVLTVLNITPEPERSCGARDSGVMFSDATESMGFGDFTHTTNVAPGLAGEFGGVATGDFDNDGWIDLYAVGGEFARSALFRNKGDGTFENVAASLGLDFMEHSAGPSFADLNGDGWQDLFIGIVGGLLPENRNGEIRLLVNNEGESFTEVTPESGLSMQGNTVSSSWGDYDRDGDLDLLTTHWTANFGAEYRYLWKNNGGMTFDSVTNQAGITWPGLVDSSFASTFSDINSDGWLDMLVVADFGTSRVFVNNKDGTFANYTNATISDLHGMGSAVGDYDNDGDMDWFVTSIDFGDFPGHTDGNRLYENRGDGYFADSTDFAGVRNGSWGWGACFADFNNDGHLDIFHVNGMRGEGEKYENDLSRLFISNGDKTFTENSAELGITDDGQGRGLVCFDYDRDGDLDIYIANNGQPPKFYCNHGNENAYLNVRLKQSGANVNAVGARIWVSVDGERQVREVRIGDNYASQNPLEVHFGLGAASVVDELKVVWPDGMTSSFSNVAVSQMLLIER